MVLAQAEVVDPGPLREDAGLDAVAQHLRV
jgi:hypothetical protein